MTRYQDMQRAQSFIAGRFARVWDDPPQRDELAAAVAREFDLLVGLEAPDHRAIATFGDGERSCKRGGVAVPVERDGEVVGFVRLRFYADRPHHAKLPLILILLVAGVTLWAASGAIARRIVRPLIELERVAREIGEGKLSSRVTLGRDGEGEVGVVAEAINDMAARIERQIAAQRELLAAVSHEMRTPLGHLRVLVDHVPALARQGRRRPHPHRRVSRKVRNRLSRER